MAGKRGYANRRENFASAACCQLTKRERAVTSRAMARRIVIELLIMIAAGVVLGFIGPFGTFAIAAPARIALWVAMVLIGYPFFRGLGVASRWLSAMTQVPRWVAALAALLLGAMPLTVVVAMLLSGHGVIDVLRADGLGETYLQVVLISAVVQAGVWLLFQDKDADGASAAGEGTTAAAMAPSDALSDAPQSPVSPRAVVEEDSADIAADIDENARISSAFGLPAGFGQVIALKGEDHYVRVYGDGGQEELVLMRLRDAIAVLCGAEGLQVHRSWWVTREGAAHVERDGRAALITLATGQQVLVSRDMVATLVEAGWLPRA